MKRVVDAIKQTPGSEYVAWRAGRVLNYTIPRLFTMGTGQSNGAGSAISPPNNPVGSESSTLPSEIYGPPLDPKPFAGADNPVLTGKDITDYGTTDFVADPFLYPGEDRWHMFFEVFNRSRDPDASIGHATSPNGYEWEYEGIIMNTGEHLSFPYVFEWQEGRYMLPETGGAEDTMVELYKAVDFPGEWRRCAIPVSGNHRTDDQIVFRWNQRWWLLVADSEKSSTYAYSSGSLEADDWHPHVNNPVVVDRPEAFRPAGRPVVFNDRVIVFYQDCSKLYGESVRAFEVTSLERTSFSDREVPDSPILGGAGSRFGWNSGRMHHVDPWLVDGRWLCAVDGHVNHPELFTNDHWSIGIYVCEPSKSIARNDDMAGTSRVDERPLEFVERQ